MKDHSCHLERALNWYPIVIAVGTGAMCLQIARICFPYLAFDPDSAANLFQAKLFAQGVLAAQAPPEFGFSSSPHIDIYNGLWFAKYPFGTSLFLAPGVLVGMPAIMPAIATCLTLLLFFAIARELFDRRVAALALLLAAFSPATVVMGSTLLSQPISRLFVALYFWSLLRALACAGSERAMLYGALAGLALGYDFNTRPLVAVVCGFASLILIGQAALRVDRPLRILPPLASRNAMPVLKGPIASKGLPSRMSARPRPMGARYAHSTGRLFSRPNRSHSSARLRRSLWS